MSEELIVEIDETAKPRALDWVNFNGLDDQELPDILAIYRLEGDTLQVERERDLALSAQFRAHIDDIDHALAKITSNTYGLCEISGLAIPKERLRAIPWARERVEYKVGGFRR